MRPPEFTGGNADPPVQELVVSNIASMRPPEFTGGNSTMESPCRRTGCGFNEAAGIHRRKHIAPVADSGVVIQLQ